jgi:tetratricopeptide (TPR) repeat protein
MTKGNTAVDNGKYAKASDHFEAATKLKKTDKASASEKQADNLVKAKSLMNQRKFSDAKKALNKVIDQDNGNKKMTSHAKDLKKQVNKIQKNRNNYKLDIKNAKAMIKAGNGDQAKSLLEQVTKAKGIKGKYYSDLYTQAKALLESVPETSTNDTTTTDANNSSNDTNTDTTTSSDDQSDNPAAKGDFDVEKREVGGKEITDQDIANARQQLTDQGVKTVGAWSDNDIIRAIKNAHADGRTTIQPSDAKVR